MFSAKEYGSHAPRSKLDIDALYEALKANHSSEYRDVTVSVQHPALRPVLRLYQSQAVGWMLQRERYRKQTRSSCFKGDNAKTDNQTVLKIVCLPCDVTVCDVTV